MIEFRNIVKLYGKNIVLNDVSFSLVPGEICGLIGVNGAGKSTIMKIICGYITLYSGELYLNEKLMDKLSDRELIGSMIEEPRFIEGISGYNNLKMLAKLRNEITDEDVLYAITKTGLLAKKDTLYKKFSYGMKQRLALAFALMTKSKIYILDEPFNGIDPITVNEFKKIILELKNQGNTILVSSHMISHMKNICDKVIIIDKGVIVHESANNEELDLEALFFEKVDSSGMAQ